LAHFNTTIYIFLPDGNPRGIRIAEITSRTIHAILIPRSKLEVAQIRKELKNVGLYFLIGNPGDETKTQLYVGEAEDCLLRIKQQNRDKEFWNNAIVIVSKTQFFTKTHIKYLEWYCYNEATRVNRYRLVNTNIPAKPFVSESMQADLFDIFETIKILVSTLGNPIFDYIKRPEKKEILICKGKDAYAEGEYTEDGFIVFAGSKCNLIETKTAGPVVTNRRKKLLNEGILEEKDNVYIFTIDHIFTSPSAAADTILARSANGWTEWKYRNGKTLDEVKRSKA